MEMDSPNLVICGEAVRGQYWLLGSRQVVGRGISGGSLKGGMNIRTKEDVVGYQGVLFQYPNSSKIRPSWLGVVDHHGILSFEIPKIQSQS